MDVRYTQMVEDVMKVTLEFFPEFSRVAKHLLDMRDHDGIDKLLTTYRQLNRVRLKELDKEIEDVELDFTWDGV